MLVILFLNHSFTVKCLQVSLFNTNNSIKKAAICLHTAKWSISSIWPIDGTLSSTTTPSQSEPESNGNEGVISFLQSYKTEASRLDGLVSYPVHSHWWASYPSAEMQSANSTVPADWARLQ